MKNKAILSIFLLFVMILASSAVLAVKDINITELNVTISGSGGDHTGLFTVKNQGDETVIVSLNVKIPITGPENKVIDITNLNIIPTEISQGNEGDAQFNINLDNAIMGEYFGIIEAVVEGSSVSDELPIFVNVSDNGETFKISAHSTNSTNSGATVYQILTVENKANYAVNVQVEKQGYDGMTFNVDKLGQQQIAAFGTMKMTASVEVPASKSPGPYTGRVNVSDETNTDETLLRITVLSTYKASVSDLTIGDVDPGQTKSVSFNIQNNGNMDLTGLSISDLAILDNDGDKLNITFSPGSEINLSVGQARTIDAKADASRKMDPGTYSQGATLSGGSISETFTVNVEVNSILKITDVEIDPDEVMPGEEFEVEVTVENVADDVDIEDVEIEVYIMDGNDVLEDEDDDEVEDDADIGDLDDGDEETITFTFRAPLDAEDGDSYGVRVVAKGENADDSSEKYEDVYEADDVVDVERPDHEAEIYKAQLDSSTLSCVKTTYIDVGVRNIGSSDEEVILTIKNDQLGIRVQDNFDLESDYDDDDFEVEHSYMLDFTSAPAGTYPITITADNDDDDRLDSETISINVQECGYTPSTDTGTTDTSGTTTTQEEDVVVQYTSGAPDQGILGATVPAVTAAPVISKARKGGVFDTPLGMAILVLGNLLLLILVIISLIYLVSGSASGKKKKQEF